MFNARWDNPEIWQRPSVRLWGLLTRRDLLNSAMRWKRDFFFGFCCRQAQARMNPYSSWHSRLLVVQMLTLQDGTAVFCPIHGNSPWFLLPLGSCWCSFPWVKTLPSCPALQVLALPQILNSWRKGIFVPTSAYLVMFKPSIWGKKPSYKSSL